jgi:hypothetical protein
VSQKQKWPDWRVPAEMIGRQPYLLRFMAGGPAIRLARALYLGNTEFRIHGTNQPETVGHAVSSGCFRLDNADVINLYDRVQVGAKVLVKQAPIRSNSAKSNPQLWTCTQRTAEMRNYRSLADGRQRVTHCCCLAEDLRPMRDRMGLGVRRGARHGELTSL